MNPIISRLHTYLKSQVHHDCTNLIFKFANLHCVMCDQDKFVKNTRFVCTICVHMFTASYCYDCNKNYRHPKTCPECQIGINKTQLSSYWRRGY